MIDRPSPSVAQAVVLVCTANVIRSPLAAAMLEQRLGDNVPRFEVVIKSAGLVVEPGRQATPGVQTIARRMGMDLSGHLSRPVTPDLVANAQMVLTMTEAHRSSVLRRQPAALSRTFTLAEFVRLSVDRPTEVGQLSTAVDFAHRARPRTVPADSPEDVPDPVGLPMEDLESVARQLDRLTIAIAGVITGGRYPPA